MEVDERRKAHTELSQMGHSVREIAEITGASKSAVARDVPKGTAADPDADPLDAIPAVAGETVQEMCIT